MTLRPLKPLYLLRARSSYHEYADGGLSGTNRPRFALHGDPRIYTSKQLLEENLNKQLTSFAGQVAAIMNVRYQKALKIYKSVILGS